MKFTYYGHSCFAIETGGKTLLFDPFITPNEKASSIDVGSLKPDYILISHAHQDHTADVEAIAEQSGAMILSNFEIVNYYGGKGLENSHPMNHGGALELDFGRVKYTNAIHSSSFPDGTYGGQPGGFMVQNDEGAFYYAGDTSLTLDMKLLADEADLDFAILPIGNCFTMGATDAARAAQFLNVNTVVGCHYDTFPPIEIDQHAATKAFSDLGKELLLPEIGSTLEL